MPPERHPHTSAEVMASVLLPRGYEPIPEPGVGISYRDPDLSGTGELSIRRYIVGLGHTPTAQVARELHLHSGDGSRRWTGAAQSTEVDGVPAEMRTFSDDSSKRDGAVITAEVGDTLISVRIIWQPGDRTQRDELLAAVGEIRLLALEDLAVRRRSQLHPVFSISVGWPEGWKMTRMDEEGWQYALPGGTCTLEEVDTGEDLSGASPKEIAVLLRQAAAAGAHLDSVQQRPTATRSPMYAAPWSHGDEVGIAAVLMREIPILISGRTTDPEQLTRLWSFVDSVRTHPALY